MENKYLIIVDMQNDFISGSLGTKEARSSTGSNDKLPYWNQIGGRK